VLSQFSIFYIRYSLPGSELRPFTIRRHSTKPTMAVVNTIILTNMRLYTQTFCVAINYEAAIMLMDALAVSAR
jgi:hypothetical protein